MYPSRLLQGLTLAYRLNSFLKARLRERWPLPTGVIRGPFKPILFRLTESMAAWGMPNLPSGPWNAPLKPRRFCYSNLLTFTGVTSTDSHSMGTLAAAKIFCTEAEISGPMPSPGMRVHFLTSLL
jgi:hypothetical protein